MFKVEVGTVSCKASDWTGNALEFATVEEARAYAVDLAGRWLAVNRWRIVDCNNERCVEEELCN